MDRYIFVSLESQLSRYVFGTSFQRQAFRNVIVSSDLHQKLDWFSTILRQWLIKLDSVHVWGAADPHLSINNFWNGFFNDAIIY